MKDKILLAIKANLGKHLTLDASVPPELGCAEAVSTILVQSDIQGIPQRGFAGTYDLWQWLKTNRQFVEVVNPEPGCIVMSPTGTSVQGTNKHGHVGIVGVYGICSNDSSTGLWTENYTITSWENYFGGQGFPVYYYLPTC